MLCVRLTVSHRFTGEKVPVLGVRLTVSHRFTGEKVPVLGVRLTVSHRFTGEKVPVLGVRLTVSQGRGKRRAASRLRSGSYAAAMPPVAVVTDSTHYMPPEVIERHGIHTVSLYVRWGDPPTDEREAALPDFDGFYDHLRSARELPSTSQPSVGDFLAVYEPLLERGADIVSIHISGAISGTVRSAEQARDQVLERGIAAERIVIVDSTSVCAGLGLMAVAAANAADNGADAAQAAARARELREGLRILFAVDTLEFLRRGGRIGGAQAWIGSTLKIKPILAMESEIVPVERVRTWNRAFERMVDHLKSLHDDGNDRFFIQHIQALDQAERLAARGEAIYGRPPEFVSEMGPVIGAHAGPGLIGVTALRDALLGPV